MNILLKFKSFLLKKIYLGIYKNGHYYSPVPNPQKINLDTIVDIKGLEQSIDLNIAQQFGFIKNLPQLLEGYRFYKKKNKEARYYYDNPYYNLTDALGLFLVMNSVKPKQIIEIGSGFSSSLMLDIKEAGIPDIKLTFVDPNPDRLYTILKKEDYSSVKIITKPVQQTDLAMYKSLNRGDVLFVDSSHVSKYGSDLNFILFSIVPRLKPGVLLHFHDIVYPFEYPMDWIKQGIFWNEAYLLRAFLMYNKFFTIKLFNSLIARKYSTWFKENLPGFTNGGSIWLEKK